MKECIMIQRNTTHQCVSGHTIVNAEEEIGIVLIVTVTVIKNWRLNNHDNRY